MILEKIFDVSENRPFSDTCPSWNAKMLKIAFQQKFQIWLKIERDVDSIYFFFPVKAEIMYFSKINKGVHKGGHLTGYFSLKFDQFFEKITFL